MSMSSLTRASSDAPVRPFADEEMDSAQQAILELALNVGVDNVHAALCCFANSEDVAQHKRLELQKASMSDHEVPGALQFDLILFLAHFQF